VWAASSDADRGVQRTSGVGSEERFLTPFTDQVHAQKHRPKGADVAVHYRGYWFYIAADDANPRAVLAILEILFALQESDGKNVGPLLTLPLGG